MINYVIIRGIVFFFILSFRNINNRSIAILKISFQYYNNLTWGDPWRVIILIGNKMCLCYCAWKFLGVKLISKYRVYFCHVRIAENELECLNILLGFSFLSEILLKMDRKYNELNYLYHNCYQHYCDSFLIFLISKDRPREVPTASKHWTSDIKCF